MNTINEIYKETGRSGCFRIRHVNSLEDWAVGNRFDWQFQDSELMSVVALFLDGKRCVTTMKKEANKREWVCLSTKGEIEWLKGFPPAMQWKMLSKKYSPNRLTGYF